MEERYLYPGDNIKPIRIGDDYRDYLLSEILSCSGYKIMRIQVNLFQPMMSFAEIYQPGVNVSFTLNGMPGIGEFISLHPLCFIHDGRGIFNDVAFDDIIVRYFYRDGEVVNMLWVSLCSAGSTVFSFR